MIKRICFLLPLVWLAVACSNQGNSSSTTTTTAHQYGTVNGSCFDYTSNVYVATNYCSTSTTGYYLSNGSCYSTSGQVVAISYCSANTSTATTGACYGYYVYSAYGYMQMVACSGANCRGYTLIESSTGRQVTCQ